MIPETLPETLRNLIAAIRRAEDVLGMPNDGSAEMAEAQATARAAIAVLTPLKTRESNRLKRG